MERKGVVCFGEIMIRLQVPGFGKLVQADSLKVMYTGAEANAGVSLANYGIPSYPVSMVPENDIGQGALNYLRRYGLDTSYVYRGGSRLGILYTETGCSMRPSKVVYDRDNSSFSELVIGKEEWKRILDGKAWFHFSGTAPSRGEKALQSLFDGLEVAKEFGVTVSVDFNYRSKLWSENASAVMTELMNYDDGGIGNEEDAEALFGIKAEGSEFKKGKIDSSSYAYVASELIRKFNLKCQAITLRESISASVNGWSALVSDGNKCYVSPRYEVTLVDRIGGGDSFSGGLIYALMSGMDYQEAVNFAVASSALKQTIEGDFNMASLSDVLSLVKGNASGRVER